MSPKRSVRSGLSGDAAIPRCNQRQPPALHGYIPRVAGTRRSKMRILLPLTALIVGLAGCSAPGQQAPRPPQSHVTPAPANTGASAPAANPTTTLIAVLDEPRTSTSTSLL